jgi:hypothetical protein
MLSYGCCVNANKNASPTPAGYGGDFIAVFLDARRLDFLGLRSHAFNLFAHFPSVIPQNFSHPCRERITHGEVRKDAIHNRQGSAHGLCRNV